MVTLTPLTGTDSFKEWHDKTNVLIDTLTDDNTNESNVSNIDVVNAVLMMSILMTKEKPIG